MTAESLLALFLIAAPVTATTSLARKAGPVEVGDSLPTFAGWDLDRRVVSLKRLLAPEATPPPRAVVISIFATWCVPCRKGLPAIARVARAQGSGVSVLLIDVGEEADLVRPFLRELGVELPVLLDRFRTVGERLFGPGDMTLPRTFVLDGGGVVRAIVMTEGADFEDVLGREVKRAVAHKRID